MSIVKNININGTVSKLSASVYDVTEQNGGRHFSGIAEVLTGASSYIPEADRTPGMQIKFIQDNEATYSVERTDGITEQPAGIQVQEIIQLSTGNYYESTLTPLQILLPAVTNSSVTYWYAETDEDEQTTTYSTWTIEKQTNAVSEYVQYRSITNQFTAIPSDWQGVDKVETRNSINLIESNAVCSKTEVYDTVIETTDSPNIFDQSEATIQHYVNSKNGSLVYYTITAYFSTGFIPIDEYGVYAPLNIRTGVQIGWACYSDKNTDSFTHGSNSTDPEYHPGDRYIRLTGLLSRLNDFMVVRGTSSNYPPYYMPYKHTGRLQVNIVKDANISTNEINGTKIKDGTLSESKIRNTGPWLYPDTATYAGTVKELYIFEKATAPSGITSINLRNYNQKLIVRAFTSDNTVIWEIFINSATSIFTQNDTIYQLTCTTSNTPELTSGDHLGYIIFSDVSTFFSINKGALNYHTEQIDISRASSLINNPTISLFASLKDFTIKDNMIEDGAVTIDKISFTDTERSINLLDPSDPDYVLQKGAYVSKTSGRNGSSSAENPAGWGRTGYIPVSQNGLWFNAYTSGGTIIGAAVYDTDKKYLRSCPAEYTYQEGDGYVRWTIAKNPVSPYTEGQYMVIEGNGTIKPQYTEFSQKKVISMDVLPSGIGGDIAPGTITETEISPSVTKDIIGRGVEICIPDTIPCTTGDTLRIYWKSIVKSPDPRICDIIAVSSNGLSLTRYYKFKPLSTGNTSVTIYVRNSKAESVAQKTITIKAVQPLTQLPAPKSILMVGASMLADGTITYELSRRLTTTSGTYMLTLSNKAYDIAQGDTYTISGITLTATEPATNTNTVSFRSTDITTIPPSGTITRQTGSGTASLTYTQKTPSPLDPPGNGITNISFVGRTTGSSYSEIHQEARGGWSWLDYATAGRKAYRFYVTGVNLLQINSIYRDSNSRYTFTITEINVQDGEGNIRCTYTGSGELVSSGTLTLISGTGDQTITYTSSNFETGNPFWYGDEETGGIDFNRYAQDYCNGKIDVLLSFTAMNDFTVSTEETLTNRIENYVKPFIRTFHQQIPSGIIILCTMYLGSPNGGMAASYGASSAWNYYTAARKTWKWSELVRQIAQEQEFSSYVKIADTNSSFDSENLYPTAQKTVTNRTTDTETVQTNGVHTTTAGKKTIADAMYNALCDILA